ncbi:MAG: hypothetical protein CL815_00100 [Coraliomargarita sp.]|nr:hypothetical protein [Coraliomargarita sp.]|tara:strand:- start:8076 stop:8375 length:300 start_codon:yes stop_codon:yes gene_type:complete
MNAITYIFLATLFYTAQPEVKENLYSWQLTFNSYEKCEQFYDRYGANLLNGVLDHGTKKYGKSLDVEYLSCAMVEIDTRLTQEQQHPKVIGQKVMYSIN